MLYILIQKRLLRFTFPSSPAVTKEFSSRGWNAHDVGQPWPFCRNRCTHPSLAGCHNRMLPSRPADKRNAFGDQDRSTTSPICPRITRDALPPTTSSPVGTLDWEGVPSTEDGRLQGQDVNLDFFSQIDGDSSLRGRWLLFFSAIDFNFYINIAKKPTFFVLETSILTFFYAESVVWHAKHKTNTRAIFQFFMGDRISREKIISIFHKIPIKTYGTHEINRTIFNKKINITEIILKSCNNLPPPPASWSISKLITHIQWGLASNYRQNYISRSMAELPHTVVEIDTIEARDTSLSDRSMPLTLTLAGREVAVFPWSRFDGPSGTSSAAPICQIWPEW